MIISDWLLDKIEAEVAEGYPISFGPLELDGTFTAARPGALPDATCAIVCHRRPVSSMRVISGTMTLPGGRKYRPLPRNVRAPVSYPSWTVDYLVHGDGDAVMAYVAEVEARVGFVAPLSWSGIESVRNTNPLQPKYCPAELVSVSGMHEYPMLTGTLDSGVVNNYPTHVILTLVWDQIDKFVQP